MKIRILALMLIVMVALTGCQSKPAEVAVEEAPSTEVADTQTTDKETEPAKEIKDTVIIANAGELDNDWNPILGWGKYYNPLMQSKLIKTDAGALVGDLAKSWTASQDCSVWSFELRDDVKFSDGHPFTAEDVVFTIEKCKSEGSQLDFSMVEKVVATSDYSVEIVLTDPKSTFAYQIAELAMVPAHVYDENYGENPIGTGPYVMVQWDKGQQLILEENPYYYGKKSEIKKIVMLFMEQTAALTAIQTGQADIAYADMATAEVEVPGYTLKKYDSADNIGICYSYVAPRGKNQDGKEVGNAVTSNAAIRKALSIACDREEFSTTVLSGYASPSFGIAQGLPWYNSALKFEDGQVAEAIQLLEEEGWVDTDKDGIREKDGLKASFTLLYPSNSELRQLVATKYADVAKEIGIEVVLSGTSWDVIMQQWHTDSFVYGAGNLTPYEFYQSANIETAGVSYSNMGYYHNPVVADYLAQAMKEPAMEDALKYWHLAQWNGETGCSMLGDAPVTWLVNINHLFFVKDGLYVGDMFVQDHGDYGLQLFDKVSEWQWQ